MTLEELVKRPPSRSRQMSSELKDNQRPLFERYQFGRVLGEGGNAVVKLLEPKSGFGTSFAIKQFKERANWPTARTEAGILEELHHKNIIKLERLYKYGERIYLILEFIDAPNLAEVMKKRKGEGLAEPIVAKVIRQLVEALAHCHGRHVYHLDVKPENIVVDANWKIKLIDFAFSVKVIDQSKMKKYCGTPSYMAPEVLKRESYFPQKVDAWAVGVVAFKLLTGTAPFRGSLALKQAKTLMRSERKLTTTNSTKSLSRMLAQNSKSFSIKPSEEDLRADIL